MSDFYVNVWRNQTGDHQWTDVNNIHGDETRAFVDGVADIIAAKPETGIRRLGILRVTLKEKAA